MTSPGSISYDDVLAKQPAMIPQSPTTAILLKDTTPVQQAIQVKPHCFPHCIPPKKEPHVPQGADPWSQRVLTSELYLHQRGLVKCKTISQLSSMLNRQLLCWLIDYTSPSKLYWKRGKSLRKQEKSQPNFRQKCREQCLPVWITSR